MPQLILEPWFLIFLASWLIFLTIIPYKIMNHYFNGEPKVASSNKPETKTWDWMWH